MVGWQEWVALPEFGVEKLRAKLDTGAYLSSLHAEQIRMITRDQADWVQFRVVQARNQVSDDVLLEAKLIDYKNIRSSSGHVEARPVVATLIELAGHCWPIELSLTCRASLEFRLLLGRSVIANRCLVDCSRTHVATDSE